MASEILVYNKTKFAVSKKLIRETIIRALNLLKLKPVEMAVLIVGANEIRRLNKVWRRKDKATNVLSFPQMTKSELKRFKRLNVLSSNFGSVSRKSGKFDLRPKFVISLGQILISPSQISPKVGKDRKNFDRELIKLLVHGLLHLLGYDHETRRQEIRMLKKENELLTKIKV